MNVQTKINSTRETNNITQTTEMAKETTLLSPRFYTTDFDELDRVDVTPIRESWDNIMEELRSDPNKNHFKKTSDTFRLGISARDLGRSCLDRPTGGQKGPGAFPPLLPGPQTPGSAEDHQS